MPILAWRTDADGCMFENSWTFDARERAALSALVASSSRDGRAFLVVETEPHRARGGDLFIRASPRPRQSSTTDHAAVPRQPHKKAGPGSEPAQCRETSMMAAKLPSRALPQSFDATKLSIVPFSTTPANGKRRARFGTVR